MKYVPMRIRVLFSVLASVTLLGCTELQPARDLNELVVRDSTYLEPETLQPFTGQVVRVFEDDPDQIQLQGSLRDGVWQGELTVYHPTGRIRYQGELTEGTQCGAWTENMDPEPPEDVLSELKQEIESMGLYPPCPDKR